MEGFVDLPDGARLAYEDVGEGPAVTLLHPGLWDMRTWDPQIEPLLEAGFRVIRYDLRGYGRSSRLVPGAPYSHVRDAIDLLDARGVRTSALVGCSMGGQIAVNFAALTRRFRRRARAHRNGRAGRRPARAGAGRPG